MLLSLLFYFVFKGIVRDRFYTFQFKFFLTLSCALYFLICCSIFKDRLSLLPFGFVRQGLYSTTLCFFCQEVFQTFFKVFLAPFAFASLRSFPLLRRPDYYITFSRVCQEVFHFFSKVFSQAAFALSRFPSLFSPPEGLYIIALRSGFVNSKFRFFRFL